MNNRDKPLRAVSAGIVGAVYHYGFAMHNNGR